MRALSKDAYEKIQDVRAGRSALLDLAHSQLEEIPEEIFALSGLEGLNLYNNRIRIVPTRICELANRKELVLTLNPIKKVPDIPGLHLDWSSYLRCRQGESFTQVTLR